MFAFSLERTELVRPLLILGLIEDREPLDGQALAVPQLANAEREVVARADGEHRARSRHRGERGVHADVFASGVGLLPRGRVRVGDRDRHRRLRRGVGLGAGGRGAAGCVSTRTTATPIAIVAKVAARNDGHRALGSIGGDIGGVGVGFETALSASASSFADPRPVRGADRIEHLERDVDRGRSRQPSALREHGRQRTPARSSMTRTRARRPSGERSRSPG